MPTSSIVFSPEISERDLDREVRDVNRQLEGMASDLPVGLDAQMDATRPAGAGGLNQTSGLLAFAEERNDTLVEIRELLDEDFVGSTGGGGRDVGGSIVGSTISGILLGGGGGIAEVGGAIASAFAGAIAGMQNPWNITTNLAIEGAKVLDDAARKLSNLSWPSMPSWLPDFSNWSWPSVPEWMNPFTNWSWPSVPEWMNPFAGWQWPDTPSWMDPFANWSFPQPPQWMTDFIGIFGGGGGGSGGTQRTQPTPTAARRGGAFQYDQGLFNAERNRGNRANSGRDATANLDTTINLDPRRVAQELTREVERMVDDAVSDLERELRNSRPETATPGRR